MHAYYVAAHRTIQTKNIQNMANFIKYKWKINVLKGYLMS